MWAALPELTVFHTACHFFPSSVRLYSRPVVNTLECQAWWCQHFPVHRERSSHQAPSFGWLLQRNRAVDILYHTININISKLGKVHKRCVVSRWKLEVSMRKRARWILHLRKPLLTWTASVELVENCHLQCYYYYYSFCPSVFKWAETVSICTCSGCNRCWLFALKPWVGRLKCRWNVVISPVGRQMAPEVESSAQFGS